MHSALLGEQALNGHRSQERGPRRKTPTALTNSGIGWAGTVPTASRTGANGISSVTISEQWGWCNLCVHTASEGSSRAAIASQIPRTQPAVTSSGHRPLLYSPNDDSYQPRPEPYPTARAS